MDFVKLAQVAMPYPDQAVEPNHPGAELRLEKVYHRLNASAYNVHWSVDDVLQEKYAVARNKW